MSAVGSLKGGFAMVLVVGVAADDMMGDSSQETPLDQVHSSPYEKKYYDIANGLR